MRTAALLAMALCCQGYVRTSWSDLQANPSYSFADYCAEYGKQYSGAEYARRATIFEAEVAKIRAHNADGTQSYKLGLNDFSDWTRAEVKQRRTGHKGSTFEKNVVGGHQMPADFDVTALPTHVDWRTKGVVSPTKNQGGCGSCWAFSATETIESAAAIATGKLSILAPQQLVSCAPNPNECGGTGGCAGSTQPVAFNYTKHSTPGLTLEKDYPYKAVTGTCQKDLIKPAVGIKGFVVIERNNVDALMHAVVNVGPVAISIDASFGSYESGVFSGPCGYAVDHAVVLVGYGNDASSGKDYWIVRNSWGESWGEGGYIRVQRHTQATTPCGMDKTPQTGVACKGQTQPIKYCGLCAILAESSYVTGAFNH